MFGILKELTDLAVNTTKIVAAPIEAALHIVNIPVKSVADALENTVEEIKK
jgi:hypothetical protein